MECKEDSVGQLRYIKMKNVLVKYARNRAAPHHMYWQEEFEARKEALKKKEEGFQTSM